MAEHGGSSERPLLPRSFNNFLSGELLISTGENEFLEPHHVIAPFKRGLTVAVTLDGCMTCQIDNREAIRVEAPCASLILNSSNHRREQIYSGGQRLRYALVHLSPKIVESHLGMPFTIFQDRIRQQHDGGDPAFISRPANAVIRSLASQIMVCPIQGASRPLFLIGKGFELAAQVIEECLGDAAGPSQVNLPSKDVDRITAARDILVEKFTDPPSLKQLAMQVGINERALNMGFRQLFGVSPSDFLQEHRLQLAYRFISSGEISVSEAAYKIGYTPTYFSTLFRRRFGVSPSEL